MRSGATLGIVLLALAVGIGFGIRRERDRALEIGSLPERAGGQIERCLTCHSASEGPGGPHDSAAIGCSTCHLGQPAAFLKGRAHAGLELEPGALDTVAQTCGQSGCHVEEARRVETSLMRTASGIVAVDRFVFGEIPKPDGATSMQEILAEPAPSAGQEHLRKLCAGCHLGSRRDNRDDAIHNTGSGCSACHSLTGGDTGHSPISAAPSDAQCLGCHSRSGRISLSYQGLAELHPTQPTPCDELTVLHDGRPACRQPADVHFEAGLACIDCHVHTELMGDGRTPTHKAQALEVRCATCHGPGAREIPWGAARDPITRKILARRARNRPKSQAPQNTLPRPEELVRITAKGTPLWNLRATKDNGWQLESKVHGTRHPVKTTPQDFAHSMAGHERLTCQVCHSAWAPTCPTCHTARRPDAEQWDFGLKAVSLGRWTETSEGYFALPPTLAVGPDDQIHPAIPGMVMTLAPGQGKAPITHRLYATLDPHTTSKTSRSCADCHRSSRTLGLGSGRLEWLSTGLKFEPTTADPDEPTQASDRWTSLAAAHPGQGTKPGVRSLSVDEITRILGVGQCIECHETSSDPIYRDYSRSLRQLGPNSSCPQDSWPWLTIPTTGRNTPNGMGH